MPAKSNTEDFVKKAKLKHGDKYSYDKTVYNGKDVPVIITCPKHGNFLQTPHEHLSGCGCQKCWSERRRQPKISKEKFIEISNKVHNGKYDYSKAEYNGVSTPVTIICPEHGEFTQTPQNHMKGQGCPKCGNLRKGMYRVGTTESFIKKAKEVHGETYDYSKVNYKNNREKVIIICPIHGEFLQKPLDHIHGSGCPECGKHLDKSEKFVLKCLREKYGEVSYQYTTQWLKSKTSFSYIDFYLPQHNIGIEYQGRQHFWPISRFGGEESYQKQSERDLSKYERCKEHGVPIFYISFEKQTPENYFAPIYRTFDDLAKAIDIYISEKSNNEMKTINENTIRQMVAKALKTVIKENLEGEYRTKGSLNKKTLEKQASQVDKTSGAAQLGGEEDYNPEWDDYSMDSIKDLYSDDEQEFDDTQAGGEFKADPSDPYFIDENGKRVDVDAIGQFHNDHAIVKKDGKVNFVDSEGHLVSREWFDACNDFEDGLAVVSRDGKRNFLKTNGELLLQTWVNRAGDFIAGRAQVIINGERHEVDRDGNIY
jgi:hypothetical protein